MNLGMGVGLVHVPRIRIGPQVGWAPPAGVCLSGQPLRAVALRRSGIHKGRIVVRPDIFLWPCLFE